MYVMGALEDAIDEIEKAQVAIDRSDDRTKLDSIAASLVEMADAEAGELTAGDVAFGDTEFEGAASSSDNLAELEGALAGLAEDADADTRGHIEAARQQLAEYRLRNQDGDGEPG